MNSCEKKGTAISFFSITELLIPLFIVSPQLTGPETTLPFPA
jgi:hypothetical protein